MRPYNFGAGPAMLPESILLEAQSELLDWQGLGRSVLEISHRSAPFVQLMQEAEDALRDLLAIPEHYAVLLLPFPARTQFAMVPMNLLSPSAGSGGYIVTGTWSAMAYQEAAHLAQAYCVASSASSDYNEACKYASDAIQAHTKYIYFTPNETIQGVNTPLPRIVLADNMPVIADMTSCLLSEPIRIDDYGLIFAGAQKNIAPAGLTLVIMRKDLIRELKWLTMS